VSWCGYCTRCGEPTTSTKDPRYWPTETTTGAESAALWSRDHLTSYDPDGASFGVHHRECHHLPDQYSPAGERITGQPLPWRSRWKTTRRASPDPVPYNQRLSYGNGSAQAGARTLLHEAFGLPEDLSAGTLQTIAVLIDKALKSGLPGTASPIEQQFWDAHVRLGLTELTGLVPQHPAGRYRLDFALPGRKIGIELDGHATHSSTKAIASDRQRQRALEASGWRIIRFGGSEVYHDATKCVREAARLAQLAENERQGK
jgi:very-short-patch-repair endonuclease